MTKKIIDKGYQAIFNSNKSALLIVDTDAPLYTIIDVNEAYLNTTNSIREALIGQPIFGVFPDNTTKEVLQNLERPIDSFEQAIKTKKAHTISNYRYDLPIPGTDQFEERYWTTTNTPVLDDEGNVMFLIHSPENVTELFTAQMKSIEQQQKLITLVANSVDLMSILNLDGTNSYINEAGRKLLGFENEEQVANTPISALHTPEDYEFVRNKVPPSVMTKGSWAGEMTVKNLKTKERFKIFNNCFRIDDPRTGQPIGVGAVMRDLRPELASKQALEDSEQLLRGITTAAPTGLWKSDREGAINYVNQTWIAWTGLSYEELLGHGWVNSVFPEDKDRVAQKFLADLKDKKPYEEEFRIKHTDGTVHWIVATGLPQYNKYDRFEGYIGACMDITEQKCLQQQKDNFIGIASHELKTPVTSIKAYAQVLEKMLLKKGELTQATMVKKMNLQINRLTNLIVDLLDVTKINAGKLQFNHAQFDFNTLVTELIEDLQYTTSNHVLVANLVPIGMIWGDRERIGQVLTNLVSNAIKYSPDTDKIIICTALKNQEVILSVQDFGIGIPEDKLNNVFEQFYRVGGDTHHIFPGLGLGLYISSEIIKRENGKIWVESKEGQGTTFYFSLPCR